MLDYVPARAPWIPLKLLIEDYRVPSSAPSWNLVSCNFDKTHLIYVRGEYTKEDEGEIVNEESTKELEQLAKDLIHPVAACQPYVDIDMCIRGEALKEGNNKLPHVEDHKVLDNISHDVVSDYIIQELPVLATFHMQMT